MILEVLKRILLLIVAVVEFICLVQLDYQVEGIYRFACSQTPFSMNSSNVSESESVTASLVLD